MAVRLMGVTNPREPGEGGKTYKAGDTRKSKAGKLLRMSASGKWFKSSNSPAATKERAKNQRLDAPIANLPGTPYQSSTTERQLAHQANAATTVQYGGEEGATKQALAQAVQHQTNVGTYYDDYQNQLKQLQTQAQAFNAGAAAAAQQLPGMVTGLAGQTQQTIQQGQAARGPEQGAIGAATTAQNASNATAVGQSMAGALAANQQLLGATNNTYMSNLANNVAPAQKIQAVNQAQTPITNAQSDIKTLKQKEGAYNSNYRTSARQDEVKNLLAGATLGLNAQKASDANKNADATRKANSDAKAATLKQQIAAETNRHAEALARASNDKARLAETKRHNKEMAQIRKNNPNKTITPATGPGSLSSSAENSVVSKVNQLRQLMTHSVWPGGPRKNKPMTAEEVRHHYQAQGVDDNIIHLAYSLAKNNGQVGPDGIRAAHALGIHVNGRWKQVGYVNQPSAPTTGSRGDGQ
jgi:hypothetical protein